jgi:hypothetical protein
MHGTAPFSDAETSNRRVDVTEFVAWSRACDVDPLAAMAWVRDRPLITRPVIRMHRCLSSRAPETYSSLCEQILKELVVLVEQPAIAQQHN